jgi:predicted amidohydrolase
MQTLRTLLVQAQLQWKDPLENRSHLQALVDRTRGDCDLIVLPETFTTGFLGDTGVPDEGMDGATLRWMRDMAAARSSAVCGSAVIVDGAKRYNRFLFVTKAGEVTVYDKRHLFAIAGEDERYQAGVDRVTFEYRGWRICPQICYDLRFPAWCRNRDDYDLLLLVANWPKKRAFHWATLLQARAIENQAWVIAVNRVGEDGNGIPFPGLSVVHDPLGETVADLGADECCRMVSLDLERVEHTRQTFPFQDDADRYVLEK